MVRRRTPVLLQVYLTTGLFVIVSWISFIVPPEVVPGKTTHYFITNKQTNIRYYNMPKKRKLELCWGKPSIISFTNKVSSWSTVTKHSIHLSSFLAQLLQQLTNDVQYFQLKFIDSIFCKFLLCGSESMNSPNV